MKKARIKELLKMATISVLSVSIFSAAFVGFNHLIFAAQTGQSEVLSAPPAAPTPPPPPIAYEPEYEGYNPVQQRTAFVAPTLNVIASDWMGENPSTTPRAYTIPMEEAALIGAEYIWDMFGECLDGAYIQMNFGSWEFTTRDQWSGMVGRTRGAFDWNDTSDYERFLFSIDANTGMRIDIIRLEPPVFIENDGHRVGLYAHENVSVFVPGSEVEDNDVHELHIDGNRYVLCSDVVANDGVVFRRVNEALMGWFNAWDEKNTTERLAYFGLGAEDVAPLVESAKQYAATHFNTTSVDYDTLHFDVMLNRGDFVRNESFSMGFHGISVSLADETGRVAIINICAAGYLRNLSTSMNDLSPVLGGGIQAWSEGGR